MHPLCCDVDGHPRVCTNGERDWWEDRVRMFVRRIEPVRDCPGDSLRAALAMGVMAVAIVLMWTEPENPFIYFQF